METHHVRRRAMMCLAIGFALFFFEVGSAAPNQKRQSPRKPEIPAEMDRLYLTQSDYELLDDQLKLLRRNMRPEHISVLIEMLRRHSDQLYRKVFEAHSTCLILMSHLEPYWEKFAEPVAQNAPDALLLKALVPFVTDPCSSFWNWEWTELETRLFRLRLPSTRRRLPFADLLTGMTDFRFVEESGAGPRLTVSISRYEDIYSVTLTVDQVYHAGGVAGFYRLDGEHYRSIFLEGDRRWETICVRVDRPPIR